MNKLKARIDAFNRLIVDAKAANVWDSIEAACIMAGWSNVAGALTPLKGTAPTNNGFVDADLDAGIGLAGDGSSYVDSNRAANANGQDDRHHAIYLSAAATGDGNHIGAIVTTPSRARTSQIGVTGGNDFIACSDGDDFYNFSDGVATGLIAAARSASTGYTARRTGTSVSVSLVSDTPVPLDVFVFTLNRDGSTYSPTDATIPFYSIGSSVDLAALDTVVSRLAADLRAIDEDGFDPLATDYIRRVEAADGAYLETGVKQAINDFIVGCRKDGTLGAIKASCIMAGARTISGALVPLVGPAPTAEGAWASGDYDRSTGLKGNGSSLYLDTNRANDADGQDDVHQSVFLSSADTRYATPVGIAYAGSSSPGSAISLGPYANVLYVNNRSGSQAISGASASATGLIASSRSSASSYVARAGGSDFLKTVTSSTPASLNVHIFADNSSGSPAYHTDARLAFYSIGSAISDLSLLDNRVSTLISSIATALA